MSEMQRSTMAGRFGVGLLAGSLTSAGLALTVESTGWWSVGAGAVTSLGFLLWAGGNRFKLYRMAQHDRSGGILANVDAILHHSIAVPEAIRTTRFFASNGDVEDLQHRTTVDPAIARIDVLVPAQGGRPAFRTAASKNVEVDNFKTLQRPRSVGRISRSDPGAISLGDVAELDRDDVPDPTTVSTPPRLSGTQPRVGRSRKALAATAVGFMLAAGATGIYLPDTSIVQETVEDVIDAISGPDDAEDASAALEEALDDLAKARPESVDLIRSFDLSYTSWTLTAYDPKKNENFSITDSSSEPDYDAAAFFGEPFALGDSTPSTLDDLYDKLTDQIDVDDINGVAIQRPESGGEPLIRYELSRSGSSLDSIVATLDGQLAPLVDPQDIGATLDHLGDALTDLGVAADDSVFEVLVIRSSSVWAPDPGHPEFLASGGVGGVLAVPSGGSEVNTLELEVGQFPQLLSESYLSGLGSGTFALSEVSADALDAVVDDAAAEAKADDEDRSEMTILIEAGAGSTSGLPLVTVTFSDTEYAPYCAAVDGNTAAC